MAAEHLGIFAQSSSELEAPSVPPPRSSWEDLMESAKRVAVVPGAMFSREMTMAMCIHSRYRWAAPFVQLPPEAFAETVFATVRRTKCTWWSKPRWWADRITLHPRWGTALAAVKSAGTLAQWPSPLLSTCVSEHLGEFGLLFKGFSDEGSVLATLNTAASHDDRATRAIRAASSRGVLEASTPQGLHVLRVVARAQMLQLQKVARFDEEGTRQIDIEAQSQPCWKKWKSTLSRVDLGALTVLRGGAAWSPTRSDWTDVEKRKCPWCAELLASQRHFFAECCRFGPYRVQLQQQYKVPATWWQSQPRVTAKSGWVVVSAASSVERRAELQIMACSLGIHISRTLRDDGIMSENDAAG